MIPNLGSNFEISEKGNSIFPPCLIARRAGRRYARCAIVATLTAGFGPFTIPARRSVGAGRGNIPFLCLHCNFILGQA